MSEEVSRRESPVLSEASAGVRKDRQKLQEVSRTERVAKFLLSRKELFAFCLIGGADLSREILTKDPLLTPEHLLTKESGLPEGISELLSHGGGLYDAYTVSMLTYYGISLLTHPIREKVPTNIKVAVASLVGLGAVVANEIGVSGGTPDLADIPSGVLGAMMFSGVMLLNKKFIKECDLAINKLRNRIKKKDSFEQQEEVKPNLAEISSQAPDK